MGASVSTGSFTAFDERRDFFLSFFEALFAALFGADATDFGGPFTATASSAATALGAASTASTALLGVLFSSFASLLFSPSLPLPFFLKSVRRLAGCVGYRAHDHQGHMQHSTDSVRISTLTRQVVATKMM